MYSAISEMIAPVALSNLSFNLRGILVGASLLLQPRKGEPLIVYVHHVRVNACLCVIGQQLLSKQLVA